MDKIIQRISEVFDINRISLWIMNVLPDVLVALITILFFYLLWKILKQALRIVIDKSKLDLTIASFLQTVLKYSILSVGIISALSQMGINITSILTSLGILGLTIGFAARDALSNVISGIFIFWDRPFVINDLVEIQGYYGRVEVITLRSTRIVTIDGKMLAIPNTVIVNQIVTSYTNFPHFRIEVEVSVGTGINIEKVKAIILNMIKGKGAFLNTPAPEVVVKNLNDYNMTLGIFAWIADERDHIMRTFELREKVFETLRAEGIDMPFETIKLAPFNAKAEIVGKEDV